MKLYISGPMSGIPAFNIPTFDEYARELRSLGHEVVSPAELDDPQFRLLCLKCSKGEMDELSTLCDEAGLKRDTWGDLLARDVKLLADGDIEGVVVLPGWDQSRGAILETMVTRLCGLPIYLPPMSGLTNLRAVHCTELEDAHAKAGGCINGVNAPLTPLIPNPNREQINEYVERGREMEAALPPPMREPDWGKPTDWEPRSGEVRVTSKTGGQKGQKQAVLGDICPKALSELAKVAGFGRTKYTRLNYLRGFEYSSAYDALQRHLHEFWAGNETDEESGLPHLAHAAWQCLCLLAFRLRGVGEDDRP